MMSNAAETLAFLHARGLDVEPKSLARELRAAVEAMTALYRAEPGHEGLTDDEVAVAQSGGLDTEPRWGVDPLARGVVAHATLATTALSAREAGVRLGVTDARIRQRVADRSLFALREGRVLRLPLFQFGPDGALPGWAVVCRAAPRSLAPIELDRWLHTPHPDLRVGKEEEPVSPREWLLAGRAPEDVAERIGELG